MEAVVLLILISAGAFVWMFLNQHRGNTRELSRLRGEEVDLMEDMSKQINAAAKSLGSPKGSQFSLGRQAAKKSETERMMQEAGLETSEARGKFIILRMVSYVLFPLIGISAYTFMIPYYATLFTLLCVAIGSLGPYFWLRGKAKGRAEEIQRELPLILDLTNLGTSAGWDVASAIERVIDALYAEFPEHPLIKELKRARLSIPNGYTWEEALTRVSTRLGDDTVRRSTLALVEAIRQGGDRTSQLEGIANDAQRTYYSNLEKRLASLPVKALLCTVLLLIAYFLMLLAPAAVQFKSFVGIQ
ncbi:MAG: type II secretion system F family protein [Bdellovibrionales bacterium]|nr:type II secretion system F family protein [Bdellovibrionales bacterium]